MRALCECGWGGFSVIEQAPDDRPNANPERILRRELGSQIGGALDKLRPRAHGF